MGSKLKTIYEILKGYSAEEIDRAIDYLLDDDKAIIKSRYGDDLNNPVTQSDWNREKSTRYYSVILPKLRRLLKMNYCSVDGVYENSNDCNNDEINSEDSVSSSDNKNDIIIENMNDIQVNNEDIEILSDSDESNDINQIVDNENISINVEDIKDDNEGVNVDENELSSIEQGIVDDENKVIGETPKIEVVDYSSQLIKLLRANSSTEQICETLGISVNQFYEELLKLKNKGIFHTRQYYSDGSIRYRSKVKAVSFWKNVNDFKNNRPIITGYSENNIKLMLISDLHFGNTLERVDLINRVYDYCAKNDINIILCGGDLVDGSFSIGNQKISDLYEQAEYFIKNYPYDENILTFSVAGDHDFSLLRDGSLDLIELLNNERHDVVIGGYGRMYVDLKNEQISLCHFIDSKRFGPDQYLSLVGHSHKYSISQSGSSCSINIPSLSNIATLMPTALELSLNFSKDGYYKNGVVKQIYFGDEDIVLGETFLDLAFARDAETIWESDKLNNVDSYKKRVRSINSSDSYSGLSQIEKFNKRYGKL